MRTDHVSIRNLDQIQERETKGANGRLSTYLMASIAGACIVFALIALVKRPALTKPPKTDPLADLVSKNAAAASAARSQVNMAGRDMAFPNLLSDDPNPTTALATIASASTSPAPASSALGFPNEAPTSPPAAADKLPVVPLPAQNYLSLGPVVTQPRDSLTAMANQASAPTGPEAPEGQSGGYQLQVSSFRVLEDAEGFAGALRKRGHRAHCESATLPGKGTWYRVRIGPFKIKAAALRYRRDFEQRERMVPFLVDPPDKLVAAQAHKGKLPHNRD